MEAWDTFNKHLRGFMTPDSLDLGKSARSRARNDTAVFLPKSSHKIKVVQPCAQEGASSWLWGNTKSPVTPYFLEMAFDDTLPASSKCFFKFCSLFTVQGLNSASMNYLPPGGRQQGTGSQEAPAEKQLTEPEGKDVGETRTHRSDWWER